MAKEKNKSQKSIVLKVKNVKHVIKTETTNKRGQ